MKTLVTYSISLSKVPVANVLPPTPTYAPAVPTTTRPSPTYAPVVPTTRPTSTVSIPFNVRVSITNRLNATINIYLDGAYKITYTIQGGQTIKVNLPAGTYHFYTYAYGYESISGDKVVSAGEYTWVFYDDYSN